MTATSPSSNPLVIKGLTYMMFMMFAMTTDSVGINYSRSDQDLSL